MTALLSFEREKDYLLREMGYKFESAFLAGGALTSTFTNKPIADFDVYFKSKQAFEIGVRRAYDDGLWCVSNSGRAITFVSGKDVIQLMHFGFFPSAQEIFDSFDFTCCMAALDLDAGEFEFHPTFLSDTSKRDLVFNHRTAYPLASALRLLKYQEKGYSVRKSEMLKIITACNMKPVSGWKDLAEQIGGRYGAAADISSDEEFSLEAVISVLDKATDRIGSSLPTDAPTDADSALAQIFGLGELAVA